MGANMVRRLIKIGHRCVVFDQLLEAVKTWLRRKRSAPLAADLVTT